jgi:hypothetical protein
MRRLVARGLVGAFLLSILLIELSRQSLLPEIFGHPMPTKHFAAISWVVTLLLLIEVLDLIFGLAGSVSNAIGKQLEIFALVLLRKTFDELPNFPEPIALDEPKAIVALQHMAADAFGALVVFGLLAIYYRLQRHRPMSDDRADVSSFIAFKKVICLLLLLAYFTVGSYAGIRSLTLDGPNEKLSLEFFEIWYTVLIFADIVVVLASMSGTIGFRIVFRNFAFAVVTVFIRFALASGPYVNAMLGVGAALFALGVSFVYLESDPRVRSGSRNGSLVSSDGGGRP